MIRGCVWDGNNKIKPTLYIILMALKQIKTVRSVHHLAPLSSLAGVCVGWAQTVCIVSLPSHHCLDIWRYDFKILKKTKHNKKSKLLKFVQQSEFVLTGSFGLLVDFLHVRAKLEWFICRGRMMSWKHAQWFFFLFPFVCLPKLFCLDLEIGLARVPQLWNMAA